MITKPESELIARLLRYVNRKTIASTKQAEADFSNVDGLTGELSPYDPNELATAIAEQKSVKDALTKIVSEKRAEAIEMTNVRLTHVQAKVGLLNGKLTLIGGLFGVQAAAWYAVALLLDETRALSKKLSRCGAPNCGRFLLSPPVRGRPVRFCNPTHQRQADKIASRDRADVRRQRERAEKLLRDGEKDLSYVRGRCHKLTREEIERIAERVKRRSR